jgi:hypothetical protein
MMAIDTLPAEAYPTAMVERLIGACEAIKSVAEVWLEQLDLEPAALLRLSTAADALETAWAALTPHG